MKSEYLASLVCLLVGVGMLYSAFRNPSGWLDMMDSNVKGIVGGIAFLVLAFLLLTGKFKFQERKNPELPRHILENKKMY